jgi:mono/diheme cytochrome c family protein
MGRTNLRAAAALLALALMAAGQLLPRVPHASAAAQKHKRPRVDARAVYERNCARCHGREGRAETEQGELYNATKFADAEWWRRERPTNSRLRRLITHGGDGMPAFGERLSAAQINALVPYVRSFNRK